jgi:hypothetical protein
LCDFLLSSVTSDGEMAYFEERPEEEEEYVEYGNLEHFIMEVDAYFDDKKEASNFGYDTCDPITNDLTNNETNDVEIIDLTMNN